MTRTSRKLQRLTLFMLPLALAWLLVRLMPQPAPTSAPAGMTPISASDVAELEAIFATLDYAWPPSRTGESSAAQVPAVALDAMPADLETLPVDQRKALFFRVLAPLVVAENRQLRAQREFLLRTFDDFPHLPDAGPIAARVHAIASRFNIAGNLDDPKNRALLLRRVDIVPVPLALAQAANESGWGRSRFTREANNLFGMWTWDSERGIRPKERAKNARYFVRVFDDLRASVNNYMHTINVGPAYRDLRERRAAQRARGEQPDALELAAGLTRYSARGEKYVHEIRSIIEYNGLHELPPLQLEQGESAAAGTM